MTGGHTLRGGMPVGYLADLGAVEAGAVLCLRLWCDGPEAKALLRNEFARALETPAGRRALRSFETLFELWIRHARRPLMRHAVGCKCLGGDEACFANFVAVASAGDREDALIIATTVVRADVAALMVSLAGDFGLALRRMAIPPAPEEARRPTEETLH